MSINAEDLVDYRPSFGWEMAPPSDSQKSRLEKAGIFPEEIQNAGKASLLIERIEKRKSEGLATPKQIRMLERKGFKNVGTWQLRDASKLIGRISANGWKVPDNVDPRTYRPESDNNQAEQFGASFGHFFNR